MNRLRRKQVSDLQSKIEELRSELESIKEEEDEYRGNMPENLWNSTLYESSEECSDNMDYALDSLEEAMGYLENVL